jgi:hypothetical protein
MLRHLSSAQNWLVLHSNTHTLRSWTLAVLWQALHVHV